MGKTIIIIGGGIAGLSTGCYSQMNGYSTQIFESHSKPGGLCTAWNRSGYTIDGCLHWLVGSAPGQGFYRFWRELGMLQGQQVINMDRWYRYETADGKTFDMYTDLDRLEKEMLEIAPEDAAFTGQLINIIRRLSKVDLSPDKAPEISNLFDRTKFMFKAMPIMNIFMKYGKMNVPQLAANFKNPLLREAFCFAGDDFSALVLLMTIAYMHNKTAGYVIGGSVPLARAAEKRYLDLGGNIKYKGRVVKILVENDRAVGVKLQTGEEYRADYVVSAADAHSTVFDMLKGKYIDDTIRSYFDMPVFTPLVYVGLGVNRSFADFPQLITGLRMDLAAPVELGGKKQNQITFRVHNFDPKLAPAGKTVVTVMIESDYNYWKSLRPDMAAYMAEKKKISDTVISLLEKRFPGLAAQVEMIDVATPVTFERYTGNWQGTYEGWLITPKNMMLNMRKTLPGLENFYMVGQWVSPGGGLPSGLFTGRFMAQILCKRDGKKFTTSTP